MTTHIFEPELNASTPRAVRFRDGFRTGCGIWFARLFILPHTVAGVFILWLAIIATVNYTRVWWFGDEQEGRITKKVQTKSKGGLNYKFAYEYRVGAVTYTGEARTSEDRFGDVVEG